MEKDLSFFQKQKLPLKQQKLIACGYFQQQSLVRGEASFEAALQVAMQKKPNAIGATLVKLCE